MAKMKEIRVSSLMVIMMAVMAMLVTSSHAQAVDFNIQCFLKCASNCLKKPSLQCLTSCITTCIASSPPPPSPSPPSPSPSPPNPPMPPMPPLPPKPPMPPLPPLPPKPPMPPLPPMPPMPPNPPTTPPTFPALSEYIPMPSPAGLNSCNFECAIRDCTSIETDMEKLKCMEKCFKLSCDDN